MAGDQAFPPDRLKESDRAPRSCEPPAFAHVKTTFLLQSIFSNLAGCIQPLPKAPVARAYAAMFRSAYVKPAFPGRSLITSALLHVGVVACLVNLPALPGPPRGARTRVDAARLEHTILWYRKTGLLPTISPLEPEPAQKPPDTPRAVREKRMAFAPVQVIISRPPKPDNQRQTIIQPEAPNLRIPSHVEVPNMITWKGEVLPPSPAVAEATRQLAQITVPKLQMPAVFPPAPEPQKTWIAATTEVPGIAQPKLELLPPRPVASEATRPLAQIAIPRLPTPRALPPVPEAPKLRIASSIAVPNVLQSKTELLPPTPVVTDATRGLAQITLPRLSRPSVSPLPPSPPKLPEPTRSILESRIAAPNLGGIPKPPMPQAPVLEVSVPKISEETLPNLIVVGVAPAPPQEQVRVPEGNRAGEFAAGPDGEREQASTDTARKASSHAGALPELADRGLGAIRIPHLSITGGEAVEVPAPVMAPPPRAAPPVPPAGGENIAALLAKVTRPSVTPELPSRQPESAFFGSKRVYTVLINMPNLTSGSGSWVLRFAELNGGATAADDISSPVAVRKVDPRYVPSAIRERVEGTVTLAANILRDGTVSDVRVIRGLDSRLDASAAAALADWRFVPAKRNGAPVDLEVLVQIPFRLPSF